MTFSVRKLLLVVGLFTLSLLSQAATYPNGAAIYTDLGSEVFIASLHMKSPKNQASLILAADEAAKMQVHMVGRMSKRRWVNMWMQGIAINTPRDAFEQQAEHLVTLFDKFQGGLQTNDVFEISYQPDSGSKASLNGIELLGVDNQAFMQLFLTAWIGNVPPSTDFKTMILGNADSSSLQSRLGSIAPDNTRVATIKEWALSEEEKLAREQAEQEKLELERLEQERLAQEQQLANQQAQAEAAEQAKAEAEKAAQEQAAAAEVEAAEQIIEEEEEVVLSVESILAQQEYTTYLLRAIYKKIRYPTVAIRRNQQGTTRITLSLNRDGSLSASEIVESSGYSSLDKAALKAIEKAAPFDALPAAMTGDSHVFTVPIAFRLSE